MLMDSKLIFFVDDDRVINNLMEYTFKSRKNYDVLTFKSGEECLDNLDQNPDLIVLDFHFNKTASARLNGLDTLKKIVSHDKGIPVIMLTSQDDEDIVDKLIENGAKRYIAKNAYFVDELMVAIDEELKN
jgi:DNA-binding response OmpR family regulator